MNQYMTVTQAAKELRISGQAIRRALARGTMKGEKIGAVWMVDREAVRQWPKRRREEAA